ncbi:MAG: 3-dehydroquinate synthase [Verrucomicrobiota bacterium]
MSEPALPPHRKVHVDLGSRAYDVVIGRGLLKNLPGLLSLAETRSPYAIINDRTVVFEAGNIGDALPDVHRSSVQSGETSKSLEQYGILLSRLAQQKIPRTGTIIALGGGVIGDLAGFVAATYLRGIAFVQVPTTLLAMVDSSVGGKTGVNLPEGKNLVGAFHQPIVVVADLDTLATLPAREFSAGMAEVIKYGAIRDAALFERVARGVKPGDADLDAIVETCVAIKARIVERDEFETKGERALLNFGHTIGHAIEKATGYTRYLHGEAISLGLRAAAWLSRQVAGLSQEDARDLEVALIANQLPVVLDQEVDSQAILGALGNDKKVAVDGGNRWVVLSEIGKSESGKIISSELVVRAVDYLRTHPDDL